MKKYWGKNNYRFKSFKKVSLGPDIMIFQNLLYKNKSHFIDTVINLPERTTFKTSVVTKLKEAIKNKLPTVALELYKISKYYEQDVIDYNLQKTLELCNLPTEVSFMRSAFKDVDIPQLGEYYYYLMKKGTDKNEIEELIFERFGDQTVTKYSDFLNLGMVLTNPDLFNRELKVHLDAFFDNVIHKYLMVFVEDIKNFGVYPETFKKDFKERYGYFSEGIKKWTFLDNNLKDKKLRYDVRSISIKKNYKYMTIKGSDIMLMKLEELYEYISFCYFRLDNKKYVFAG